MGERKEGNCEQLRLNLSTLITLLVLVGSIVATFFIGQAQSTEYTNQKVAEIKKEITPKIDSLYQEMLSIKIMTARIDQTLIEMRNRKGASK